MSDIADFLTWRMKQGKVSSTSLIITIFGDAISQHGEEIWLGSLINLLAPLGISERLARTAVFRLVQDDWLVSHRAGRRSYYRFSDTGHHYHERAARRIYAAAKPGWDHGWTIVIPAFVSEDRREALRKGLTWQGFGQLASGVFAMPSGDRSELDELLSQLDVADSVVVLDASSDETTSIGTLNRLVRERWKLDEIGTLYRSFLDVYEAVPGMLDNFPASHQEQAGTSSVSPASISPGHTLFLLRILLIHDYRRVLLRDPELPAEMLPGDWIGFKAQALTASIYRRIADDSARWLEHSLENEIGALPAAIPEFTRRYRNTSGRNQRSDQP
jgi:phenylacetic acid degradation operon negative regulatory protein